MTTAAAPAGRWVNLSRNRTGDTTTMPERYDHATGQWVDATDPDDARDEQDARHAEEADQRRRQPYVGQGGDAYEQEILAQLRANEGPPLGPRFEELEPPAAPRYDVTEGEGWSVCSWCAALVSARRTHTVWHQARGDRPPLPPPNVLAPRHPATATGPVRYSVPEREALRDAGRGHLLT